MKVCKPIMALLLIIIFLSIVVFFERMEIDCLENEVAFHTKQFIQGTKMGFSGDNFTGIVCNMGYYTAYNVKLVLYTDTWSYDIALGNITGASNLPYQFVEFNEYVPITPESGDVHNTYRIKYEYSESPYG